MLKVIYEDNHILVCEKPVNMPVQADSSGDLDLLSVVKQYVKEKYSKPGDVYIGMVHRLDRPVGGVMVFARTSKAASRLTDAFKRNSANKNYAALVSGNPRGYATLEDYLVKDEETYNACVVDEKTAGAKLARLDYARVCAKNGATLIDVKLHTGRHHQIRAQLANAGICIMGDRRYNPNALRGEQIALYAYRLEFEHPTKKELMSFTSQPTGEQWQGFCEELKALCSGVRLAYIDENILAVNKESGITCANADGGVDTLEARLNCAFGEVFPVHRLDAATEGIVLFARSKIAENELKTAIKSRQIKKTYVAEVAGVLMQQNATLTLYGKKQSDKALMSVYNEPSDGTAEMITEYEVLWQKAESALLKIGLITGKTHQIRASLAHIGNPIIGDDKYGDRQLNKRFGGKLRLCAMRIDFNFDRDCRLFYLNGKHVKVGAHFWDDGAINYAAKDKVCNR